VASAGGAAGHLPVDRVGSAGHAGQAIGEDLRERGFGEGGADLDERQVVVEAVEVLGESEDDMIVPESGFVDTVAEEARAVGHRDFDLVQRADVAFVIPERVHGREEVDRGSQSGI
jgi:hypothetical protein